MLKQPCKKCGADDRYKNGNCRPCLLTYQAKDRVENPEKYREQRKNKRIYHASRRARWVKENPEAYRKSKRKSLLKRYDLTIEDFESLAERQNYKCAICEIETELVVDHCHTTNKVRGLLCNTCNLMLGYSKDNPDILHKAIKYLV